MPLTKSRDKGRRRGTTGYHRGARAGSLAQMDAEEPAILCLGSLPPRACLLPASNLFLSSVLPLSFCVWSSLAIVVVVFFVLVALFTTATKASNATRTASNAGTEGEQRPFAMLIASAA